MTFLFFFSPFKCRLEVKSIPEFLKFCWSYEFQKSRNYCFKAEVDTLQPKARSVSQVVIGNEILFEHSHAHSFDVLSTAAFALEGQNYLVVTETI